MNNRPPLIYTCEKKMSFKLTCSRSINPNTLSCDMSQIHVQLAPLRPLCSASQGLLSGSAWGPNWTLSLTLTHSSTPTICTLTPTQLSQFRPPCSASHRLLRKPALGPIWTLLLILAATTRREILPSLLAHSSLPKQYNT